ncbi:ARM repeat-containing protein [Rozella allomycis CSF55]|uniref:ARM repeat-containing protein n=1 Tax=Rozella allomycis (strain CSF55) TaxID=988480 RepID=A0A4P9YQX5_ROZAC|nr:ARM repeat-containing protein [Rozella allomycis CSF55]
MQVFTKLFSSSLHANFPYTKEKQLMENDLWKFYEGKRRSDDAKVGIFISTCNEATENAFKIWKTLKHPFILDFKQGLNIDRQIYISTELVVPLTFSVASSLKAAEKKLAIFQIAEAISFLNEECNLYHMNHLMKYSAYMTQSNECRLGGFEFSGSNEYLFNDCSSLFNSAKIAKPPECSSFKRIRNDLKKIDSYTLGVFIFELFNETDYYYGCSPGKVPYECLPGGYFDDFFISTSKQMESFIVVSDREVFLRSLSEKIEQIPINYLSFKTVIPIILHVLKFGNADGPVMDILSLLFNSNDRSVRIDLLKNIEVFAEKLDPKIINNKIYKMMASGFSDCVPSVRENTMIASLLLTSKLSEKTLNDDLISNVFKLLSDEQPGIRTNAIIAIGKLCPILSQTSRKKYFVDALILGLQDTFKAARESTLKVMSDSIEIIKRQQGHFTEPKAQSQKLAYNEPMLVPISSPKTVKSNLKDDSKNGWENLDLDLEKWGKW